MYSLIRVYNDGTIIEGKKIYSEFNIEQLSLLISGLNTVTYEFAIAYFEDTLE